MTSEDSPLHDVLSDTLQRALDKKLTAGEEMLMTLAGAHGEGLVVTDRRVIILREQMPLLAGETVVDSFDYAFDLIESVRVEGAVGGGHLKLDLLAPPVDDKQVTLFFPSYDQQKFHAAAARMRMLVEQTRSVPTRRRPNAKSTGKEPACPRCGAALGTESWSFCAHCGAAVGDACAHCRTVLPPGARFCPGCGASSEGAVTLRCAGCGATLGPRFSFCPHCGQAVGSRCGYCGEPIVAAWKHCAACGHETGRAALATTPSPFTRPEPPEAQPGSAEEHNARGMSLYNQERCEEAILEFERALDLQPGNPLYHCNLGVVYAEMGRDEEALEEYETAIRLAPNDPTPWLNLGYFHSERENDAEARRCWERVVELAPDSPEAAEARDNIAHSGEV